MNDGWRWYLWIATDDTVVSEGRTHGQSCGVQSLSRSAKREESGSAAWHADELRICEEEAEKVKAHSGEFYRNNANETPT